MFILNINEPGATQLRLYLNCKSTLLCIETKHQCFFTCKTLIFKRSQESWNGSVKKAGPTGEILLLSVIRGIDTCDHYVFTDERVVHVKATFSYFTMRSKMEIN